MRTQTAGRARAGIALVEVIVAVLLLSIAIERLFSSISYALMMTIEGREYSASQSLAERAGFLSVSENRLITPSDIPGIEATVIQIPSYPKIIKSGDATKTNTFKMRAVVYKDASAEALTRKMKSPLSIVFLGGP